MRGLKAKPGAGRDLLLCLGSAPTQGFYDGHTSMTFSMYKNKIHFQVVFGSLTGVYDADWFGFKRVNS